MLQGTPQRLLLTLSLLPHHRTFGCCVYTESRRCTACSTHPHCGSAVAHCCYPTIQLNQAQHSGFGHFGKHGTHSYLKPADNGHQHTTRSKAVLCIYSPDSHLPAPHVSWDPLWKEGILEVHSVAMLPEAGRMQRGQCGSTFRTSSRKTWEPDQYNRAESWTAYIKFITR